MDEDNTNNAGRIKPTFVPVEKPDAWEKQLLLSTIPLKCLSEDNQIQSCASGCLIDYLGHRFILSVSHATLNYGRWVMEERAEGSGIKVFPMPRLSFLGQVPTSDLIRILRQGSSDELSKDMVDFCYGIVPDEFRPLHEEFSQIWDHQLVWSAPRTIFKTTLDHLPKQGVKYGFSGQSNFARYPHPIDPDSEVICGDYIICGDLSYLRTEDDVHTFQLAGKHPGNNHFKGCFGAPILSEDGELMALVMGGNTGNDTIQGISVRTYRCAINLAVHPLPER